MTTPMCEEPTASWTSYLDLVLEELMALPPRHLAPRCTLVFPSSAKGFAVDAAAQAQNLGVILDSSAFLKLYIKSISNSCQFSLLKIARL